MKKNYLHLEIRGVFRTPKTPLATGLDMARVTTEDQ